MVKSKASDVPPKVKHELPQQAKEAAQGNQQKRNDFINDLASLTYYGIHGTKTAFESLPEAERDTWARMAGTVLISLDKLNKMVVVKVEPEETEERRLKNVALLKDIVSQFVQGVKTVRCPRCGSSADLRPALFPCEELAFRILEGKVK